MDKNIKNGLLSFGGTVYDAPWNNPTQYASREKQYFMGQTERFRKKYLKYSSDFFDGTAQGLYGPDVDEWIPCKFRLAEVVRPSSAIQREFDDYKHLYMEEPALSYIPQGTKFNAMGSIWLMVNPANVTNGDGSGIVRRCRVTWNHLDYYGNILHEPFVVDTVLAAASSDDSQQWNNITKGYFNIICQSNQWTNELNTNSRIIFGSGAYRITGFSDFLEEFTGEFDSTRLIRFTARYEEPNDEIDDMVNRVAGGLTFSWDIRLSGRPTLTAGSTETLTAESHRMGQTVTDSEEHPITYLWSSSDESVATVDESGTVTAAGEGSAVITCTLEQNPEVSAEYAIAVVGAESGGKVAFLQDVPEEIGMYQTVSVEAAWFEDGVQTAETVAFRLSGPPEDAYSGEVSGNVVTITCWAGSNTPLTVTAEYGEHSVSEEIYLRGI